MVCMQRNHLIKEIDSERRFQEFILQTTYTSNRGKQISLPVDYGWWEENKSKGASWYYKQLYKSYYASYFDIRDIAKKYEKDLFNTKIHKAGKLLVIDTVASKPPKILGRLKKTRQQGYHNIIVYLEIQSDLAVARDKWREKNKGRGVGASIIDNYAKNMSSAYKVYKTEGKDDSGLVDRLMYFKWYPAGASPIKGVWKKLEDNRYSIKRKIRKLREK